MKVSELRSSLGDPAPPPGTSPLLVALWHAARNEWDSAHRIAQDDDSAEGAWVHAYLHRVEGDESNAAYWYRRAARPHSQASLDDEWTEIANALV